MVGKIYSTAKTWFSQTQIHLEYYNNRGEKIEAFSFPTKFYHTQDWVLFSAKRRGAESLLIPVFKIVSFFAGPAYRKSVTRRTFDFSTELKIRTGFASGILSLHFPG